MKYDANRACVTLSVGELCALSYRPADLDLRFGHAIPSLERAHLGSDVHRKIQGTSGAFYAAEVSLSHTAYLGGTAVEVSGRADGVISDGKITLDEIKTVRSVKRLSHPYSMHEAQAKCYAYFLCCERSLEAVQIRMTYVGIEDGEEIKYFCATHTKEELKDFFYGLLSCIEWRVKILFERATVRLPSAAGGRFPFSTVRKGQDVLMKECYRDIRAGKRLFAEAPTGIGKTISTLYPATRVGGEGGADKIFYLTAKAAVRREAFSAAGALFSAGAHLRTAVLTAREQLCFNARAKDDPYGISRHCNPVDCPYAKGFYERAPQAICELLSRHNGYSRRAIEEISEQYKLCPYEFQLELSELCDILICDYNYVFDPQAYLRRYFASDGERGSYIFLVDEAHNLADRARAMYSSELSDTEVTRLISALPEEHPLKERLSPLGVTLYGLRRLCRDTVQKDTDGIARGYYINHAPIEDVNAAVFKARLSLEGWLKAHRDDPYDAEVQSFVSRLKRFELIAECYDERSFLTFVELEGERCTLRLLCLDPSHVLDAKLALCRSCVLFSATLTPIDYFADILGGGKGAVTLTLPSPFDTDNFYLAALTGISTRFDDREKSYKKLVSVIAAAVSAKRGNYIVYFPSYDYMERVAEMFQKKYPTVATVCQTRGMSASQKECFLDAFCEDGVLRVGFCVLGGSFSEGVDLPGRRLIGTVIVGTGLSAISNEGNILCEHYEATRERGFDYAYVYPGMNRVLQAAGRVIRREEDRGIVVLVDDRYADARTQMLFPDHWQHVEYARNASELAENVHAFWEKWEN